MLNWDTCLEDGVATIKCFEVVFQNIITASLSLVAIALFLVFIFAGFKYLTSQGDQKQIQEARNTFTYAIIGLFLYLASFLILKFIEVFTGVSLLEFKIPEFP